MQQSEPHSVGQPTPKRTGTLSAQKRHQIAASWVFGLLLLAFLFYAFLFSPDVLSVSKQRILAFVCALIAGIFGFFITGRISVNVLPEQSRPNSNDQQPRSGVPAIGVQASGGLAAAVLVLIWWLSPWAPVLPAKSAERTIAVYRVRITVLDPKGLPVEDSEIRSSLGGELKKVAGGWELDIPAVNKPADGKLTIYALNTSLRGSADLKLEQDPNLAITIQLQERDGTASNQPGNSVNTEGGSSKKDADKAGSVNDERKSGKDPNPTTVRLQDDPTTRVYGRVIDDPSHASIHEAKVSVVGFEKEAVLSGAGGDFNLPAHAAMGEMVRLRVEKEGYLMKEQLHPAGKTRVTILLQRK